jgi:hypothetical protein
MRVGGDGRLRHRVEEVNRDPPAIANFLHVALEHVPRSQRAARGRGIGSWLIAKDC